MSILSKIKSWPRLQPSGRARAAGVVIGVLTLVGGLTQIGVSWATALPSDVALQVGDKAVTEAEFEQRVQVLQALYGVRPPEGGKQLDQFRRDAAKSIAVSEIVDDAAAEQKVVVGEKPARDALDKIIEQYLPQGRDGFTTFLASQGISEQDVLDEVRRQLVTSKLLAKVTGDVEQVGDEEVRATYDKKRSDMVRPESRHLRNIVVESRQAADKLRAQAGSGGDFAALAKRHSLDRSTAGRGGDLGSVAEGDLDKAFAEAAFAAKQGEVFGPVQTQYGWNVGYVESIKAEQQLSYQQAAEQLKQELNDKRKLDVWRQWLGDRIAAADVEYGEKYLPANPDAPPADSTPAAPQPR